LCPSRFQLSSGLARLSISKGNPPSGNVWGDDQYGYHHRP
jgi:hypothetical protein